MKKTARRNKKVLKRKDEPLHKPPEYVSYEDMFDLSESGKAYSDDELREKFRKGLDRLEARGDVDVIMSNVMYDYETNLIIIWKALRVAGVSARDMTGRQMLDLQKIISYCPCEDSE